jgi:hypothetical protein
LYWIRLDLEAQPGYHHVLETTNMYAGAKQMPMGAQVPAYTLNIFVMM